MRWFLFLGAGFTGYLWYRGGASTSDPVTAISHGWSSLLGTAKGSVLSTAAPQAPAAGAAPQSISVGV